MLTGTLHKWLGWNDLHDDVSLYSFSWLQGGSAGNEGISFRYGASFFISSFDAELLKRIVMGIQIDSSIGFGLYVMEVIIQDDPKFENESRFICASPVLVKRRIDDKEIHMKYDQTESDAFLTETLKSKMKKAGLPSDGVLVEFDRSYHSPKTKVVYYNKIGNRVNICPVVIKGTPEQLKFAWNVGVGNSTGIGFGALK
jgi:CRISPR-associated endoribonuclease Cas6